MQAWTTFTETVLFITEEEKEDFLRRYLQKTKFGNQNMSDDDFHKALNTCLEMHYGAFKQLHTNAIFGVNKFEAENKDGGILCAFDDTYMDENDLDEGFYIVTDHPTTPIALLRDHTYSSIDDIIAEFKSYAGDYLPEDFDWMHHAGTLYYSICE